MRYLIAYIFLFLSFESYAQTVEPYVSSITKARIEVESNIEQSPYKKEQQEIFKNYFIEISEFINDINGSDRLFKRFQSYTSSNGVSSFCKNVLLEKNLWNDLIAKCTKNRFFLCAEEIKAFDLYKESLKRLLTKAQQDEFSTLSECK